MSDRDNQYILAQEIAKNVCVQLEVPEKQSHPHVITLGDLLPHARAEIVEIDDVARGSPAGVFLDMGLLQVR